MNISIIVYSETKNTFSVAQKLKTTFEEKGDTVKLIELLVHDTKRNKKLVSIPTVPPCDVLILATPVQGFSAALPMKEFLKKSTISSKQKVFLVITQYFKKSWLGGNQALKQMKKLLLPVDANVEREVDIHWSSKNRDIQIEEAITQLSV